MAVNIQQQNQSLTSFFFPLDHQSPLLPQLPDFDCFFYERGPRYDAYADLRESKLRAKRNHSQIDIQTTQEEIYQEDVEERSILTPKKEVKFQRNMSTLPKRSKGSLVLAQEERFEEDFEEKSILTPKKEVKFQRNMSTLPKRSKGSSILAQSVPDFGAVMRKENRKPSSPLPPGLKSGRGGVGGVGGSKSVNSGEKKGGSVMARKSYASMQELKGLASIARGAIDGENKVGVTTRASTRNALRYSRHF